MVLQLFRAGFVDGVAAILLIGATCFLQGCEVAPVASPDPVAPSPTPADGAAGPSPAVPAPTPPSSYPNGPIKVVSLNLADGQRVSQEAIAPTVGGQMPADLLGFQEPRGWLKDMSFKDSGTLDWYQSAEKDWPRTNPTPIAWNKKRFEVLYKGHEEVARDRHGARVIEMARLKDKASGKIILFANSHGPVHDSQTPGWEYDKNMADAIKKNRGDAEVVIVTGDFNTGQGTLAKVREIAGNVIEGNWNIDMIISNDKVRCQGGAFDGGPSDHDGVQATCDIL
jgi:hypothetical protein